jgi:hypothetical protein
MLVFAVVSEKPPYDSTPMADLVHTPGGLNEKPEIQRCSHSESVYSLTKIQFRRKKAMLGVSPLPVITKATPRAQGCRWQTRSLRMRIPKYCIAIISIFS